MERTLKEKAIISDYENIQKAIIENDHNKSKAAIQLGIDRKTLWNKVQAYKKLMEV